MIWEHRDLAGQSVRQAEDTGTVVDHWDETASGAKIENADPYPSNPNFTGADTDGEYPHLGTVGKPITGCAQDGIPIPDCSWIFKRIDQFELLEQRASAEFLGYSVLVKGRQVGLYKDLRDAKSDADLLGSNTLIRNWRVNNNWFQIPAMSSLQNQRQSPKPSDPHIMVPVGGVDKLKSLMEATLNFKSDPKGKTCGEALDALLRKIGENTGFTPSHTTFKDLLNAITSQTKGGGLYVDVPFERTSEFLPAAAGLENLGSGGGGVSTYFYVGGERQRISVVFLKGAFSTSPRLAFDRLPFAYVETAIHELFHNAPNDASRLGRVYEHDEMDAAARDLDGVDFDRYVKKYCTPKKYW